MAKVFVTGGTGFIGYHLIKALSEQGHEILCLARKTSRIEPLRQFPVKFIHGDIQDADSIAGTLSNVQVVFHLAGTTKALRREDFFRVNELGIENLLKACRQSKATPVVVFVSSLAAAGPVIGRNPTPKQEGAPSNPVSLYGISKRAGELVAERYARDLPITIVRPGIVFGEWDKDCLEMFRPIEKTGVHLVPGYRQKRYSLIYAGDLVNLLISAATKGERLPPNSDGAPPGQGYYFAACDETPSYAQLGRLIGQALGRRTLVIPVASPVVWTVAFFGEIVGQIRRRPVVFHWDKAREALAGSWICSASKARDQLGFQTPLPLAERLRQTAAWYREAKWL